MRIVQFSVQGNHVHLVVEAVATQALSRAMQGFSIRLAKRLNAMMNRRGRVLADRALAAARTKPELVAHGLDRSDPNDRARRGCFS